MAAKIDNTYCEALEGLCVQLMVTAQDVEFLNRAAIAFTALPSTVFGDAEGVIVRARINLHISKAVISFLYQMQYNENDWSDPEVSSGLECVIKLF